MVAWRWLTAGGVVVCDGPDSSPAHGCGRRAVVATAGVLTVVAVVAVIESRDERDFARENEARAFAGYVLVEDAPPMSGGLDLEVVRREEAAQGDGQQEVNDICSRREKR